MSRSERKIGKFDISSSSAKYSRDYYIPPKHDIFGGFEAPRNSLDIVSCNNGMMRMGHDLDIPVGYEVSTSRLKTRARRTRGEDSRGSARDTPNPNPNPKECTKMKPNFLPHGSGARSVVARLMGLDPLPQQQKQSLSMIMMSDDSKVYSGSSAMMRPQGLYHDSSVYGSSGRMHPQGLYHDKSVDNNPISSLSVGDIIRNMGYGGADPLRKSAHHPQEKQLAKFKREFAAKFSTKETLLSPMCFLNGGEDQDEEEEEGHWDCLDASHFMVQTNNKVLLAHAFDNNAGSSMRGRGESHGALNTLRRSFSESRKDRRRRDLRDEAISCANLERFNHNFDGIVPNHAPFDETIKPTKIVVLKPNLGRNASHSRKPSMTNGPLTRPSLDFSNTKAKAKELYGKENHAKAISKGLGFTSHLRSEMKRTNVVGEEPYKDIARKIAQQMEEERSARISRESIPRRTRSENDRYFELSSRKSLRDDGKQVYSSGLSVSSRHIPSRSDLHENVMRRSVSLERQKGRMHRGTISTNMTLDHGMIPKEKSRGNGDAYHWSDNISSVKQENYNLRSMCGNMLHVNDHHSAKLLPRSLSAPSTSFARGNQTSKCDPENFGALSSSHKSKSVIEASIFKGKLLILKDNFLSSKKKKKSKKKQNPSECSLHVTHSPIGSNLPRDELVLEQRENYSEPIEKESRHDSTSFLKESTSLTNEEEEKREFSNNHLHDTFSLNNNITPNKLICGDGRWGSMLASMDNTSETITMDKCEQPSPISVLESLPYQEESPNSDTQERLDSKYQHQDGNIHGTLITHTLSSSNAFELSEDEELSPIKCKNCIESTCGSPIITNVWGVEVPLGRHEEFTYIKDILAFVGFTKHENVMKYAISMEHKNGLDPTIFMKLEEAYQRSSFKLFLNSKARRLLFDVVGEIVSMQLKACEIPWRNVQCLYMTGSKLLEQIWAHLSLFHFFNISSQSGEDINLDTCIANEAFSKDNVSWVHTDIQSIANELEILILDDLIHEIVHDCMIK